MYLGAAVLVTLAGCNAAPGQSDAGRWTRDATPGAGGAVGDAAGADASASDAAADSAFGEDASASDAAATGGDGGAACDCPEDDNPCTQAACTAEGQCVQAPADEGLPCHPVDACATASACTQGVCVVTGPSCDDGDHCTVDRCVAGPVCADGSAPVRGSCLVAAPTDGFVDQATALAACRAGGGDFPAISGDDQNAQARHAADVLCGVGVPAYLGLTDADGTGRFTWPDGSEPSFAPWADGAPAAGAHAVALTADGRWVATDEPLGCYVCTAPTEASVCVSEPGDPAVLGAPETCNGIDDDCDGAIDEVAEGAPGLCDDQSLCTEDVCLGADGCAHAVPPLACDDGVACTVDLCDPVAGCGHQPVDALCDDGVACTLDRCDPVGGCSNEPSDAACDDGVDCTADSCDPSLDCQYVGDDAACDDGLDCTVDVCRPFAGCGSDPQNAACDDGDGCTDDVCTLDVGCSHPFNEAPCDDGNVCTAVDQCVEGECTGVVATICDDRVPCTADACDPALGCVAPLDGNCDAPGPAAGFFEGRFLVTGHIALGFLLGADWHCEGALSAVVDASQESDLMGIGDAACAFTLTVLGATAAYGDHVDLRGVLHGLGVTGTVRIRELSIPWNPTITLDDTGLAVRLAGSTQGQVLTRQILSVAIAGNELLSMILAGVAPPMSDYTFSAELNRVPVNGECCGPAGCEPSVDSDCYHRGALFSATDAGRCCIGELCTIRRPAECAVVHGNFVPAAFGACCTNANSACNEMSAALCDSIGGIRQPSLSCDDANADGLPDACGAPANFGYSADATCTPSPDGQTLTVNVSDRVTLTMHSAWVAEAGGYHSGETVAIDTPEGLLTFPQVVDFHVGCGARFTLIGHASMAPALGGVDAFSGMTFASAAPALTVGYAYGYELRSGAHPLEGPFADGRPYLFVAAEMPGLSGGDLGLGDVALGISDGDHFTLAVDPTDPALIFDVGGDHLSELTGGIVDDAGFGVSRQGALTWRSAVDLFDGEFFTPAQMTGHLYRAGTFNLPLVEGGPSLAVDGDMLIDLGTAVDAVEHLAPALVRGDLRTALVATVQDLDEVKMAGNMNSVSVTAGPLDFQLANGSWLLSNGRFTFSANGFTPGEDLARGNAGELFQAFSALTLRGTSRAFGYIDEDGPFHVTIEGSLAAGPFELDGVRLILDSVDGIRIEGGSFGMDFGAFLEQLQRIMDCQFDDGTATCSVGGIPVASLHGELGEGGFVLGAHLGLPVVGQVDLWANVVDTGDFDLQGTLAQGLPGFHTTEATVILRDDAFSIVTSWNMMGDAVSLYGYFGFDGAFDLRGTGNTGVAGFPLVGMDVDLNSDTGFRGEGTMNLLPAALGQNNLRMVLTVPPGLDQWHLEGSGDLAPFGYSLARVRAVADAGDGQTGVQLEGEARIATASATLSGRVTRNDFRIAGRADLNLFGYSLGQASVTLDGSGLQIDGNLNIMGNGVRLIGRVETNGDFLFATQGNVQVPIAGFNVSLNAQFQNRGGAVSAAGTAWLVFAGQRFDGSFSMSPGHFSFDAGLNVNVDFRIVYASGRVSASIRDNGFGANFHGEGCLYVPLFPDPCTSGDFRVNSDGDVYFGSPVRRWVSLW